VLGQAHTPRRRLLGIAVASMIVLAVPAIGGADPNQSPSSLRHENANLAARSRAAVLSLYSLDSQLASAQSRLATLQGRANDLRRERASLALQLRVARAGVGISQRRVAARLRALYEQGDVSALEVVLGAKSLDEALNALDNLGRVAALDESVLAQVTSAKHELTSASHALAARSAALDEALREAAATTASLAATRADREAYIQRLAEARSMNTAQISLLERQAQVAQARAARLAAATPTTAAPSPIVTISTPAPGGAGSITVTATGYALTGATATGLPVGWGVAAVDPSVIPLGTHMTIPGYGEAVAADTGGAVVGSTIDLWFPTEAQAQAWGRRTVTVALR
jgi:3D (Asp-Asp-Asp) domain-containing protein/peptidoglycan hydrolase CwlO-like protein